MRFKEYLILEYNKSDSLREEIVLGGINKVLKRLEFWFDGTADTTRQRIRKLRHELVAAGGPQKFAMIVRRLPSVKHWMIKHADELSGDLRDTINLI